MKSLLIAVLLGGVLAVHAAEEKPAEKAEKVMPLKVLNARELDTLLKHRLSGGLGYTFGQFANMFMVSSNIGTGTCVGLKAKDGDIVPIELQSVFPDSYKPMLSELLDAIALQTFSRWSYNEKDQTVLTDEKDPKPGDQVVIISFNHFSLAGPRKKPFQVTPAKGWKHEDRGNWETYIPPVAPVGMDIYEMGRYSAKKDQNLAELMLSVRKDVALEWAHRVSPHTLESELTSTKVGSIEALYFGTEVSSKKGPKIHWRQWVFTVGDRCYFIVSTLFVGQEEQLLPEVEQMVASFKPVDSQ